MGGESNALAAQYNEEASLAAGFVGEVISASMAALATISSILPDSARLVEDSTLDLNNRFRTLADATRTQGEAVQELIDTVSVLEVGGEQVTITDFIMLFNTTLHGATEKILNISKQAMAMVYALDTAIANLTAIEDFTGRIQKITKQTHLLSLNATIEASRAGVYGQGFGVVAHEVKAVSAQIDRLAEEMQEKIGLAAHSVREGYHLLQSVATTDMSENINAKEKLDGLMEALVAQNHRFKEVMQGAASTSHDITHSITGMIMGMQFQDRNTQVTQNSVALMVFLQQAMERILTTYPAVGGENALMNEMLNVITLGDIRAKLSQALHGEEIAPPAIDAAEQQDDVELF